MRTTQESMAFRVEVHNNAAGNIRAINCDTLLHAMSVFHKYRHDPTVRQVKVWAMLTNTGNLHHEKDAGYGSKR